MKFSPQPFSLLQSTIKKTDFFSILFTLPFFPISENTFSHPDQFSTTPYILTSYTTMGIGNKRARVERDADEMDDMYMSPPSIRDRDSPMSPPRCAFSMSADKMAEMKRRVYATCGKRKNGSWAKCPKYINDQLIETMMVMARATPEDVFLDIGSGTGNVVESVATRVGCRSIGVEFVSQNYDIAMAAKPQFETLRKQHGLRNPCVEYHCNDIRKVWDQVCDLPTIIWCSNKLFGIDLDIFLLSVITELKPGTRIFLWKDLVLHTRPENATQRALCQYFTFQEYTTQPGDVEWTDKSDTIHLYTRTDYCGSGDSSDEDL